MRRTLLYGRYDPKKREYLLSRLPPDAPVRPSVLISEQKNDIVDYARRKHADVYWWPVLEQGK